MGLKTITSDKYKELSDIEHVLLRAEMYTGSRKPVTKPMYFLFADRKIYVEEAAYVPAVLTLANEVMNNAYDEYRRSMNDNRVRKSDSLSVVVDLQEKSLTVRDNGGIPVVIHADSGKLLPELLFGQLRSGSNYSEDRGDMSGTNGIGGVLVNIFSTKYSVTTADGEHMFVKTWFKNMSESEEAVVTPSTEHFTEIKAYFDIDRFPADSFNLAFARMIEMRCAELAAMGADMHNPLQVSWTTRFQEDGKSVEWHNNFVFRTFQDYLKLWPNCETMIVDDNPRFKIAITPSLGSQESIALVNSIRCDWGTHTDAYVNACVYHIKNYLNNKFKVDVWPSKIKSYIKTISTWQIDAPTFSGQTKEQLVTPVDEFGMPVMPSEAFIKKLLKSPIVSAMVEDLHNKIMQQKKAELAQQQKALDKAAKRNIFPTKLTDAARAGKPGCDIFVVEGDSAAGGFKRYRHAEHQGVFAMFGKSCGNMLYADEFKVLNNKSQAWLMQALGLSFTNKNKLRYDRIIMAQDADYDGYSILGLMLVFYNKFFPELLDNGNLYRLLTPIVSAKRGKEKQIFYNLADFEAVAKDLAKQKFEIKYIKGLASLSDDDYEDIMNNPQLVRITRDDLADDSVTAWFGKESYRRKELMGMADLADDFFGDLQAEIESEFNDLDAIASDFTFIDL